MSKGPLIATVALAALMLTALPAWAHVTVRTDNPEPGGFAVYTVRVPNESDTGSTTRIEVQIPEGLQASRYQPKPGWDLAITDGVLEIEGSAIAPGQFEEFRFQGRNPEGPGQLVFPAIQTYDDGEEVAWTGEAASDTPAAVVDIQAAPEDGGGGGTDALVVAALVLGVVGTLLGAAALFRPRRT